MKVPENERARERKYESSRKLSFPENESSGERKVPGTKMKVLHRDLLFLGTKGLGYEKSVIPLTLTLTLLLTLTNANPNTNLKLLQCISHAGQ